MFGKIYFSVLLSVILLISQQVAAHSQDDNLADKLKESQGPQLPTQDNIVQASGDNLDLLLGKQLKDNMLSEKKHRPLLMALVLRSAEGNLAFQRELIKLAEVTHRNFEIAIADCQFERAVCDTFSNGERMDLPTLFLFKEGKIWTYAGQRTEFTKEIFLDYLSGDNYKDLSIVYDEDMQGWLEN